MLYLPLVVTGRGRAAPGRQRLGSNAKTRDAPILYRLLTCYLPLLNMGKYCSRNGGNTVLLTLFFSDRNGLFAGEVFIILVAISVFKVCVPSSLTYMKRGNLI